MHGVMGCSWGKNPGVKGKVLISITVFNKSQIDLSSGSVKCRPLNAPMDADPPTGCNTQYPSLPFFPAFPPTFQNIKITVLQFLLEKSIYDPTVIGRDHQNREESGKEEAEERWGTEEFIKQEEQHVLRVNQRGGRPSKAGSQLPYALTKIRTAAASVGSWFIISPSPSSGETHLAPCWTFIRPDSHQMVSCFGSGAVWSSAGEAAASQLSWEPGLEPSSLPGARAQRRGLAKNAGAWLPFTLAFCDTKLLERKKIKFLNPSSLFLNLTPTENKMEGEKKIQEAASKNEVPVIFTWNPSKELSWHGQFFFFLTSGL